MTSSIEGAEESAAQWRPRASLILFVAGIATWYLPTYPLQVGDYAGITAFNVGGWAAPLAPIALVLAGLALNQAPLKRRAVAIALAAGFAVLMWVWPFGSGFYSADAWGDRFVASLAYPVLTAAWAHLKGWPRRALAGLAPLALIVLGGTLMYNVGESVVPASSAIRSTIIAIGPLFVKVTGAGIAAAVIAVGSLSLAERFAGRAAEQANEGSAD